MTAPAILLGEPANRLTRRPTVEARGDEDGRDGLPCELALGLRQVGHRPDLELRSKSLNCSDGDRTFILVAVRHEKLMAAADSDQDAHVVGRHEGSGAPGCPHPKPAQFDLWLICSVPYTENARVAPATATGEADGRSPIARPPPCRVRLIGKQPT